MSISSSQSFFKLIESYGSWSHITDVTAGASIPHNASDANSPPLPFPPPSSFPPSHFPSLPLSLRQYPLSPYPPPSFPSFPFTLPRNGPLKSARGLEERFSSPSGVRGRAPAANIFGVNLEPMQETHLVAATYNKSGILPP